MRISDLLKRENNNLDLMRIILASMVIMGHAPFLNGNDGFWTDPVKYLFPFTYAGAVAVKLFFFISGLVVTNSLIHKKSVTHFIISRSFRLMPALCFVLVITVFVFGPLVTTLPVKDYFSELHYLAYIRQNLVFKTFYFLPGVFDGNFYKLAVNGSLWSLRYEVAAYIVMIGLFIILRRVDKKYYNIPVLLLLADALLPSGFMAHWLGNNPEINLLPAVFAFGVFYAINQEKLKANAMIALISLGIYFLLRHTIEAEIIMVFALCHVVLFLASSKWVLKLKPKHDISYGIYLWGFLIQQTIYHFIGPTYIVVHCLMALAISVILALGTFLLVEKPFMEYGKKTYLAVIEKLYKQSKNTNHD
jgi:peptidoglycan/LPS O-acetylase OafA/YrhL